MKGLKYILIIYLTSLVTFSAVPTVGITIKAIGKVTYVSGNKNQELLTNQITLNINEYEEYFLTPAYDGLSRPILKIAGNNNPVFIHRLYNLSNLGTKKLSLEITTENSNISELPLNIITSNNEVIEVIRIDETKGVGYIEVNEGEEGIEFYYAPIVNSPIEGEKYSYDLNILEDPQSKIYRDSYILDNTGDIVSSYIDIVEHTSDNSKIVSQKRIYEISLNEKAFALISLGSVNGNNDNLNYNLDLEGIFEVDLREILVSNNGGVSWVKKNSSEDPVKDIFVKVKGDSINITTNKKGAIPQKKEDSDSILFGMPVVFAVPLTNSITTEKRISLEAEYKYESLEGLEVESKTNSIPTKTTSNNIVLEMSHSLDGVYYSEDVLSLVEGEGLIYYQIKLFNLGGEEIDQISFKTSTPENTEYFFGEYKDTTVKAAYYQVDNANEVFLTTRLNKGYKGIIGEVLYNIKPNSTIILKYVVKVSSQEE